MRFNVDFRARASDFLLSVISRFGIAEFIILFRSLSLSLSLPLGLWH